MKERRRFVGDFETTVFKGQEETEVWASAIVEIGYDDVKIFHSIDETYEYLKNLNENIIVYYHNLKFDGSFWVSFLLDKLHFTQASIQIGEFENEVEWLDTKNMPNSSFKYMISSMGQWYNVIIKVGGRTIELRDSLKLLPFSVKRIGSAFKTKHQKLDMEYEGFRYAGCEITDDEKKYIANDVLVVKEALEIMFEQGHKKLTIGSCCLEEFKSKIDRSEYAGKFPNLFEIEIPEDIYGIGNAGDYIRRAYRGGWCYLVKGKECRKYDSGTTADVNSLYPSMMSSESGNYYPIGKPHFFQGEIPEAASKKGRFYFVRFRTRFYIKDGYLPFIQIKGNPFYRGTECLESSDIVYKGKSYRYYVDRDGVEQPAIVTLTMTMMDFELMKKHYHLEDFEILDGCWFYSEIGIFDEYINKYKKIKMESKGALRELAKLFLNNLYGKMASSTNSSFKYASMCDDDVVRYYQVLEFNKKPGYIPIGAAITSYARNFTIKAAQQNYHGVNEPGFIYADTDSIHCDLPPDKIVGITVHPTAFCSWKLESCWDIGWFVRQKTYIEHIVKEDLEPVEKPYYNIKAAGMPKKCKDLYELSMNQGIYNLDSLSRDTLLFIGSLSEEEIDFIKVKRTLKDFDTGLSVPGKLLPVQIKGGTILKETTFTML